MFTFEFISDPYSLAIDPKCITDGMWVIMDYSRRKTGPLMDMIVLGQLLRSDDDDYRVEGYGFFGHIRFSKRDLGLYKYTSKSDGDYRLSNSVPAAKGKLTSRSGAPVYTVETWKGLLCPDWETSIPKEFWVPMTEEGKSWRP